MGLPRPMASELSRYFEKKKAFTVDVHLNILEQTQSFLLLNKPSIGLRLFSF